MRTAIILAFGAAALSVAGCKKAGPAGSPVGQAEALQIATASEADYNSGDAAKIMSHYAKNALAFDPGHSDPSTDPKVIEGWVNEYVSMKPADFELSGRTIQLIGPDAFVTSGIGHFTVAAGAARPQVGVRISQVYQRQNDGSWKIVNEHMSMPPNPPVTPAQ